MPLHKEDFEFEQDAVRNALRGVAPNENCVLWGCFLSASGGDFHLTEGMVVIDKEIFYVPAHTVEGNDGGGSGIYTASNYQWPTGTSFGNDFSFEIVTDWDPQGSDTFHDGNTKDTYRIRQAKAFYQEVTNVQPGDTTYLSIGGPLAYELDLKAMTEQWVMDITPGYDIENQSTGHKFSWRYRNAGGDYGSFFGTTYWPVYHHIYHRQYLTLQNGWVDASQDQGVYIYKDSFGYVGFGGVLDGDNNSVTNGQFHDGSDLTSEQIPHKNMYIPISDAYSPGINAVIEVNTSGAMSIIGDSNGIQNLYALDGARYHPDPSWQFAWDNS